MQKCSLRFALFFGVAGPAAVRGTTAAQADSPTWAQQQAQNQELQRQAQLQQAQQAPSPQVQQFARWKQEWVQQHPNQPIPSLGVLEHLHEGEIIANTNAGFAKMRQARQAQLQQDYQRATQNQERTLTAQHITWSAQQWKNWEKEYDLQMQQHANDYLEALRQAGEMEREEQRRKAMGY
jgi:hypothetical protein